MLINVRKAIVQQIFLLQEQILADRKMCSDILTTPFKISPWWDWPIIKKYEEKIKK